MCACVCRLVVTWRSEKVLTSVHDASPFSAHNQQQPLCIKIVLSLNREASSTHLPMRCCIWSDPQSLTFKGDVRTREMGSDLPSGHSVRLCTYHSIALWSRIWGSIWVLDLCCDYSIWFTVNFDEMISWFDILKTDHQFFLSIFIIRWTGG